MTNASGPVILRLARLEDAPALARLHVAVWVETYGQMAPPDAVARLDVPHRLAFWTSTLSARDPVTLLGISEGQPLGLVCFGAATDPVFGGLGEVRHLYVLGHARGQGLGRRLLSGALQGLRAAGHAGAGLAVVDDNHRARAFYRAAGGTEGTVFTDKGPLWRSRNRLVTWSFAAP
jgi:GNAT superfamily N-acetyltransferase